MVTADLRGHGPTAPRLCHIADRDGHLRLLEDEDVILKEIHERWAGVPVILFAHSMGGAVASLFLERYSDVFSAAVLCAPMIAPHTGGVPFAVADAICGGACSFGRGKNHPFFMKPWSGPEDFNASCATDPVRFAWYDAVKTARGDFRNSVPTYQWTRESLKVTQKILAPGAPEKIACPVLLSTAEHDSSVLPDPQKQFISRVPEGRRIFVAGARHEIFRSRNEVFFPWWHEILAFFRSHSLSADQ